jgi:hypothetical protein
MEQFSDLLLTNPNQMDVDQPSKDETFRQEMSTELNAIKQEEWPLLKLSKLLCQWMQKLENELSDLDE